MRRTIAELMLTQSVASRTMFVRSKTTSAQYVASRFRDPTFEKLMDKYKNLLKVISIQDLILANPKNQSVSLDFLTRLSQKLHLNRGPTHFLRKYPHIFRIFYDSNNSYPSCTLTHTAFQISRSEAEVINDSLPLVVNRLVRLLVMSKSKSLPLRAIFKVWRELGLPDDFEDSVIGKNRDVFVLLEGGEPNTHVLKLFDEMGKRDLAAAVDDWRVKECCRVDSDVDRLELRYRFPQNFPSGMRLSKDFKAKVKEWQRLPYVGAYEEVVVPESKKTTKARMKRLEKRAVAILHEFVSLTVEKMVEVEKISHFRKPFGIEFNIRDLFLDHPGIFYLSTKGKRHTVFLREAYERGQLAEPNSVYEARRKLLDLVVLGRHDLFISDPKSEQVG